MVDKRSPYTNCVHVDHSQLSNTNGVNTPIYTSTSYRYSQLGKSSPNYPRYLNTPNQEVLSRKIAELEHGKYAFLTSSGLAAITGACLAILKTGDHAIFQKEIYGGTYSFVENKLKDHGIEYSFFTGENPDGIKSLIKKNTKLIYAETPSNPLLTIVDLEAITKIAKANNLVSIIDNTFATPINQKPLDYDFDVVVHSATKYFSGHSDIIAGAIILNSDSLVTSIQDYLIHAGATLDAQTCYLLERSIKTLAIRMDKHNTNAQLVAEFLEGHSKVKKVFYPGLKSFIGHELAKKQMTGFGGMMSVELNTHEESLANFVDNLKIFIHAVSLGAVESLISVPRFSSHSKMSQKQREEAGVSNTLIRLSIGIEDTQDLINDLKQALDKL